MDSVAIIRFCYSGSIAQSLYSYNSTNTLDKYSLKINTKSLNKQELDWLDNFLFERIEDDADTEGKDEGILFLSELDGFMTAMISGPDAIQMSRWLPYVWGDFEPKFESDDEMMEVVELMVRHMNNIVSLLMEQPEDFLPIYLQRVVKGEMYLIVDEWCEGYMRGVAICEEAWCLDDPTIKQSLAPIKAFVGEAAFETHQLDLKQIQALQEEITPNVRSLHAYWLAFRSVENIRFQNQEARTGRNDPCPCGSGKKFKKCCLH